MGAHNNRPQPERIEPWTWQRQSAPLASLTPPEAGPTTFDEVASFDLETLWRRGAYRGSLFAPTDRESDFFLDRLIREDLFPVPATTRRNRKIDSSAFLRSLARYNGCPLESLRGSLQWDKDTFSDVTATLIDRDLIFTLPFEPIDGRADLYYFRDTGVLHRLFNPKWTEDGRGREYFAKSWEGLVVQTLIYGPGRGAAASVWRQADNEIDLVLRWPRGEPCWVIEIGMGKDKRPSKGFWVGARQLAATRRCVVHRGDCGIFDDYERFTLERFLESCTGFVRPNLLPNP